MSTASIDLFTSQSANPADWGEFDSERESTSTPVPPSPDAPKLDDDALYGLAGRIIKKLDPQTESHPAGNLVELLISFGSVVGRSAYYQVEDTRHYTNEMMVKVGRSSKARKGTGKQRIRAIMKQVDAVWLDDRNFSGLGSGEVVMQLISDPVYKTITDKKTGESKPELIEAGVDDKRLHVNQGEFQGILTICHRQDSTLSVVIRDGWDGLPLKNTVKTSPATCMEPHFSIAADTTQDDLSVSLSQADSKNGFANRFLWVYVDKTKNLPFGGDEIDWTQEVAELRQAVAFTKQQRRVFMDKAARDYWARTLYTKLEADVKGLVGSLTSRASAHVLRLSLLYALLDCSDHIRKEHLQAAEALWKYCSDSVHVIFGELISPEQAKILDHLDVVGTATRSDLYTNCFGNHRRAALIANDLTLLESRGKVEKKTKNEVEYYSRK